MNNKPKYIAWLLQAQDDFRWAQDSLKSNHFVQTCFIAQQIGEKAIKAVAYYKEIDQVKSHSIVKIAYELKINGNIERAGKILDRYYMTTRYPDSLPDNGIPYEYFDQKDAEEAISYAKIILDFAVNECANKI